MVDDRVRVLRARFRTLHESGCFVLPNPWDVGSAQVLVQLGFPALASTSAGFAWSIGHRDNAITLDDALVHLRTLVAAVPVPVNADFEGGFAVDPEGVATNVTRAVHTGVAGLSIEDSTGDASDPLFPMSLAVERIAAARAAIDAVDPSTMLVGRCELFLTGRSDIDETVRRLQAYAAAGADCLYAPGVKAGDEIAAIVQAVAPKPVNVVVNTPFTTVEELASLGVRRVSVGGALARAAWTGFLSAAREIAVSGTFVKLGEATTTKEMNAWFPVG